MRLTRGVPVAGLDPGAARDFVKWCHNFRVDLDWAALKLGVSHSDAQECINAFVREGYLEPYDFQGQHLWITTLRGGGLANASFLRPITRSKADALLHGVLERAAAYNADPTKILWVDQLVMFGSMVDPDVELVGDVDLNAQVSRRSQDGDEYIRQAREYSRASGRNFASFLDQLAWPAVEVRRLLKNRSGYISIHEEDITRFTDAGVTVYRRSSQQLHGLTGYQYFRGKKWR